MVDGNRSAVFTHCKLVTHLTGYQKLTLGFSSDIEAVLGVAGRYATANVKAMRSLSWTNDEYERLMYSWSQVEEIPEAPGGYYLTRDLDNAFRDVVYNSRNARESLLSWKLSVDSEISRKREEFGLD